jgi:PhnB protein
MNDATSLDSRANPPPVSPYLTVEDGHAAIDFYTRAFGAVERMRMVDDQDRVGHADIAIGPIGVMLADEHPEMGILAPTTLGGSPVLLYLHVDDVDAAHASAVAAGATSLRAPEDQFHGNRTATVEDPFGHHWMLATPIEALTAPEMGARAAGDGYTTTVPDAPVPRVEPIGELGYWTLNVPDVARGRAFYGALLGWAIDAPGPDSSGTHTYAHVHNTKVPMGLHDGPGGARETLYYRVDDLAATTARVLELGGEVLEVQEYASGGNARCRDDQGIEFQLWQPAPGY